MTREFVMSAGFLAQVQSVDVHQVSTAIKNRIETVLIIDSRSFIEHNACHISSAVNVCCSKIVKRRLQQDKLSVKELLIHTCHCDVDEKLDVVAYDQCSKDVESLPTDGFITILLKKLLPVFRSVNLLSGGFDEFQKYYPELCEDKARKCAALTSLSQPCLPISNQGPTRILPFLYLGSQYDALNRELLKDHNITYELNVSTTCPQPEFVQEGHFMRIPVNDTYIEKLLPYFPQAFNFLDKVREGSGCVLVHCLAGISRSPTIAIGYVMRYLHLSSDDGYRYVKSKRPTISPNFNFLGQLLEYEKQLRNENILEMKSEISSAPPLCSKKRLCRTDMRTSKLSLDIDLKKCESNICVQPRSGDQSPTTALANLSFDVYKTPEVQKKDTQPFFADFRQYRSKSCYGDWLRDRDEADRKSKEHSAIPSIKVLSPVKEIKCDGLISEISTGQIERNVLTRQRRQSLYSAEEERNSALFSSFHKLGGTISSDRVEKFSIHTLTHQSTFTTKSFEFTKSKEQQKIKLKLDSSQCLESKICALDKEERRIERNLTHIESGSKRMCHTSLERFPSHSSKNELTHSAYFFQETQPKVASLHPFSFSRELCKRSDSGGTSGFGSESSDYADINELSRKYEADSYELEDDVLVRKNQKSHPSFKHGANERSFFPLSFPNVVSSKSLSSPLSPSECHLLDDLDMEKEHVCTGPSSPSLSNRLDDSESLHDSGVPMSPVWTWPKKRVTSFGNNQHLRSGSPTSDKRKHESFKEPIPSDKTKMRTLCFNECVFLDESMKTDSSGASRVLTDCDKIGLYRVQSCPGIITQESSICVVADQSLRYSPQKYFRKDSYSCSKKKAIITHESCPDVLHLRDVDNLEFQTHRQREFRRNVRAIQVS